MDKKLTRSEAVLKILTLAKELEKCDDTQAMFGSAVLYCLAGSLDMKKTGELAEQVLIHLATFKEVQAKASMFAGNPGTQAENYRLH
jgi:hypothetical protein